MFSSSRCQSLLVVVLAGLSLSCNRKTESSVETIHSIQASNPLLQAASAGASGQSPPTASVMQSTAPPTTNGIASAPQVQLRQRVLELTGKDLTLGRTTLDPEGRPAATEFPDGSRLTYQASNPIKFIDPGGLVTAYTYANGKLVRIVYPDGRFKTFPADE